MFANLLFFFQVQKFSNYTKYLGPKKFGNEVINRTDTILNISSTDTGLILTIEDIENSNPIKQFRHVFKIQKILFYLYK